MGASKERRQLSPITLYVVSFLLLGMGTVIYILFRAKTLLVFDWLEMVSLAAIVELWRRRCCMRSMGRAFYYSLPDGLWVGAFAICLNQRVVAGAPHSQAPYLWICLPVALGVGSELGQLCGVVPGTFDPYDILLMLLFSAPLIIFRTRMGVEHD